MNQNEGKMNAGVLSLVFCKAPFTRPDIWALSRVVGNPIHVDIGVGGMAFAVSPKLCIQADLAEWIEGRRRTRTLCAVVEVPIERADLAWSAAMNFAVGPMTYAGVVRRIIGRADPLDVDCVAAAMLVLAAGGVRVPRPFKTARSLYQWIASRSTNS